MTRPPPDQLLRQLAGRGLRRGQLHHFVKHTRTLEQDLGSLRSDTEGSTLRQAEVITVKHLLRQMDRLSRHLESYLRHSDERRRALRNQTPLQSRDHAAPYFGSRYGKRKKKRKTTGTPEKRSHI